MLRLFSTTKKNTKYTCNLRSDECVPKTKQTNVSNEREKIVSMDRGKFLSILNNSNKASSNCI
jgi:hypothetical protein